MRFDIITIFPEFFAGPLDYGIVRRAREAKLIETNVHDLRAFTHDRHRTVDDRPFGGGEGMVMKPEPLFDAVESLVGARGDAATQKSQPEGTAIVLLSAAGKMFRQETARKIRQARTHRADLRALRRRGRARGGTSGDGRDIHRGLRVVRRRTRRGNDPGRSDATDSRRARQRRLCRK